MESFCCLVDLKCGVKGVGYKIIVENLLVLKKFGCLLKMINLFWIDEGEGIEVSFYYYKVRWYDLCGLKFNKIKF